MGKSQYARLTDEQKKKYQEVRDLRRQRTPNYWRCQNPEKERARIIKLSKAVALWRKNNPEKNRAQRIVFYEVRAGRLTRQNCVCGKKGEAHHEDYSKPLEIIWLCKKHHRQKDIARRKREANG